MSLLSLSLDTLVVIVMMMLILFSLSLSFSLSLLIYWIPFIVLLIVWTWEKEFYDGIIGSTTREESDTYHSSFLVRDHPSLLFIFFLYRRFACELWLSVLRELLLRLIFYFSLSLTSLVLRCSLAWSSCTVSSPMILHLSCSAESHK